MSSFMKIIPIVRIFSQDDEKNHRFPMIEVVPILIDIGLIYIGVPQYLKWALYADLTYSGFRVVERGYLQKQNVADSLLWSKWMKAGDLNEPVTPFTPEEKKHIFKGQYK